LRDRKVYPQDNPLPPLLLNLIDRISQLQIMKGCVPNEANAIDYHKKNGDYLKNHVDDRQLSKEPIANLSLAGDCFMTFRLERHTAPQHFPKERKVLLKRRTLQILTSNARYDYSHGIQNEYLLSDRRISITMRESPLSM
jgi:alkylated DNA repair protein alkB family protein 4